MIDINTIKLIIWDLDETFWNGTLSEAQVSLPEGRIQLIKDLTNCGIINSICSKNDFEDAKRRLQDFGLWDYFVFPSINWESKGPQLKDKLDKMALRPVNTLFLDDNPSNLGEARHYLPDIQIGGPDTIGELMEQVSVAEKKDTEHKRLKQYKILEEKDTLSQSYASSEDFLYDSRIQVAIHHECMSQIQRIHELLMRSNQLNYTKKRITLEELRAVIEDADYDCGYVTVLDRFGDYGIVGFYALKKDCLEHFFFSCRTMGQKIEQWVYAQLGFPKLEVVGEVRTELNNKECPGWINCSDVVRDKVVVDEVSEEITCRILMKGPCDLSHSQMYIKNAGVLDTEFTYVSNAEGQIIDAYNHSVHIEGLKTYSEDDKRQIVQDCIFVDPTMLEGGFFTKKYDVIFLSTLIESIYLIYRKKGTDIRVVFGGEDLTDSKNWKGYCEGTIFNGGNKFTEEYLRSFSEKYECLGFTSPEMYIDFLRKSLKWLPEETTLCLILGATKIYEGEQNKMNRHKALNYAVREFAADNPRIQLIEIDDCVRNADDFQGGINHFSTRVYYEIARQMIRVIQERTGKQLATSSSYMVFVDRFILKVRKGMKRVFNADGPVYKKMKGIYNRIYKNRK